MRTATPAQIAIAQMFQIPKGQEHTVNILKYTQYMKYRFSPDARLDEWLDKQEYRRISGITEG